MNYSTALEYLDGFVNYEHWVRYHYQSAFSLERMERFMNRLGDPHRAYATGHIAGTKGKGSTAAFTASILSSAGWKVGLYTSPHLSSFRERIQVGGSPISEEELVEVVERIRPVASRDLTYFEVTTACAFLHFAMKKVDAAILEVGMGGRLDATNVVSPEVAAITPISFDHVEKLGSTLRAIAREKAGIIKPAVPLVVAAQEREVLDLLQETAQERNVPLHLVEEEVQWERLKLSCEGTKVSFRTLQGSQTLQGSRTLQKFYPDLIIPLLGRHQVGNAATAVRMAELFPDVHLTEQAVRDGLAKTVWPGRCQLIKGAQALLNGGQPPFERGTPILLDGAQNAASAKALRETVESLFPGRDVLLVVGISLEKDLAGIASVWGSWAKQVIVTQALAPRSESPDRLEQLFRPFEGGPAPFQRGRTSLRWVVRKTPSVKQALEWARAEAATEDLIVVAGSLFVVAEALQLLQPETALNLIP